MLAYVETYRAVVAPAQCDHLGHMNVQYYFAAVSDGMFAMMVRLGLGPAEIRERKLSFAVVRAETDFLREVRAGDVITLESTVEEVRQKAVVFQHRLKDVATGEIAMRTTFACVLLDLDHRTAAAIPEDIRARALQLQGGLSAPPAGERAG